MRSLTHRHTNRLVPATARWPAALATLAILGGCIPQIVYRPSATVSPKPELQLRVAVLPFKDGTEDPPHRKFFLIPAIILKSFDFFNEARPTGTFPPLMPPELWAKSLAAELRHEGVFAEVQYGQDFGTGAPDILIEGTLQKVQFENRMIMVVIFPVYIAGRQEYGFSLRALRASDRKLLWEGKVERSIAKMASGSGEPYAAIMQSMLLEASQNLVKGLQAAETRIESSPAAGPATGADASVDQILRQIQSP